MSHPLDFHFMTQALNLAHRGLGRVSPNPAVGCVIVKGEHVVGVGWTADGGRPHAETIALEMAGHEARGASAYVSLEPCAHQGQTPPCTKALIEAGIKRVVVACSDPDSRVSGKGIQILEDAGIEVVTGVLEEEARALNRGFFLRLQDNRPLVTLKTALTIDGKIALHNGQSQWITGEEARRYGHFERSQHDAILIGSGTALSDDPNLTTRLPGVAHKGIRIICDSQLKTVPDAALFQDDAPVWILHEKGARNDALDQTPAKRIALDNMEMKTILKALADEGLTRVLVEGGARIQASFIKSGLFDRLLAFRAPSIIGQEGLSAFGDLNIDSMASIQRLSREKTLRLGQDLLEIYRTNA